MMNLLRLATALVGVALLGGGYLMSLGHFFGGTTAQYTQNLDSSPLRWLCLALLVLAVVLAFLPDKDEAEDLPA